MTARITKAGNWAIDWTIYYGRPATTYYRKADIKSALQHYGYRGDEQPNEELSIFIPTAAYFCSYQVKPYRTTY